MAYILADNGKFQNKMGVYNLSAKSEWVKERDQTLLESIEGVPKKYLRAKSNCKGMRDCVRDWYGYYDVAWLDYRELILDSCELLPGGRLVYRGYLPYSTYYINGEQSDLEEQTAISRHNFDLYEMYLCSDGKIRYIPNADTDAVVAALVEEDAKTFWDSINAYFEAMGMFYNEKEGCWINPITGETGCY